MICRIIFYELHNFNKIMLYFNIINHHDPHIILSIYKYYINMIDRSYTLFTSRKTNNETDNNKTVFCLYLFTNIKLYL